MPGAFVKSVAKHANDGRQIRMYYQHDSKEIIGGFNPAFISEDPQGLKVVGEINLDVQRGREVYALAKQGVLGDFSIGYTVQDFDIKDGIRQLREIDLWEISIVSEPANPKAKILQVKKSDVEQIKSRRDVEKLLRESGLFSRSAAAYLASLTDETKFSQVQEGETVQRDVVDQTDNLADLLANIRTLVEKL
jgi:HK97 family phage prohead protease